MRDVCKILRRSIGVLACLALAGIRYSQPMRQIMALPDTVYTGSTAQLALPKGRLASLLFSGPDAAEVAHLNGDTLSSVRGGSVTYRLFGVLPVKTVEVLSAKETMLVPGGTAVGITIRTQGVLVVGLGVVETTEGSLSPGSAAGIKAGDLICTANGEKVLNADHLMEITAKSTGELNLELIRDGQPVTAVIQLVKDRSDNALRMGLWVRDSTAGVGTLSFYDPQTGWFAALGHPVSDVDTQSLLTIRDGRILKSEIVDVKKGEQGSPGELVGMFSVTANPIGTIEKNTQFGIFGPMKTAYENQLTGQIPLGYGYEAHTGKAQLLATISKEGVEAYGCEVIRVNAQSSAATRGMVIHITDDRLLEKTGGIVQGMSGCPVLQDGKLIGVVTHVFVNDPTRGYCVYAEWMQEEMRKAS